MIAAASDRKLVMDLLKTSEFRKMMFDSVGKYEIKMDWSKDIIQFIGKRETANLKLSRIIAEIKNPTKTAEVTNAALEKHEEKF